MTITMTGPLEPRAAWTATHCPLAKALELVGTRSAMLILREAFYGTTRFDDFAERVGLSQSVAAARLRELVDAGLLEREPYQESGQRARAGYRLTAKGTDLLPALVGLMQWAADWYPDDAGFVELRHHDCGARVRAQLTCAESHAPGPDDLELALVRPRPRRHA